eukprot:scaffold252_cov204-Skeletonema_marinoi.AAC.4
MSREAAIMQHNLMIASELHKASNHPGHRELSAREVGSYATENFNRYPAKMHVQNNHYITTQHYCQYSSINALQTSVIVHLHFFDHHHIMNALRTTTATTSKMFMTRRFASGAYRPKTIDFTVSGTDIR